MTKVKYLITALVIGICIALIIKVGIIPCCFITDAVTGAYLFRIAILP